MELDDDVVLYDPRCGQTFLLNRTGAQIWSLCDGTRTAETIAREIATTYGLAYSVVLADVHDLISGLRQSALLV